MRALALLGRAQAACLQERSNTDTKFQDVRFAEGDDRRLRIASKLIEKARTFAAGSVMDGNTQ